MAYNLLSAQGAVTLRLTVCLLSGYSLLISAPIRKAMPTNKEMALAIVNPLPTYEYIFLNRSADQEETPEPNIAATIYLALNKNAAIVQKTTPVPLRFIIFLQNKK